MAGHLVATLKERVHGHCLVSWDRGILVGMLVLRLGQSSLHWQSIHNLG